MPGFTHLPPLTDDEVAAITAYLACDSILDAASHLDMPLGRFLDLLASPGVQTHLDHADALTRRRAEQRLLAAAHTAAETLESIAADTEADVTERRRAATTIVNAFRPRRRRPRLDADPTRLFHTQARAHAPPAEEPVPPSRPSPRTSTRRPAPARDDEPKHHRSPRRADGPPRRPP